MKGNAYSETMRRGLRPLIMALAFAILPTVMFAQNSAPAPGSGGSFNPAPPSGGMGPGPGFGPAAPPPNWGGPWGPGWSSSPSVIINAPIINTNSSVTNVMACGYDAMGNWRTLPLTVAYQWNGVQYDVTVINAWNPWTDSWNRQVDRPAYNTSYYLNGTNFDFYTVLSTGTYYFNL